MSLMFLGSDEISLKTRKVSSRDESGWSGAEAAEHWNGRVLISEVVADFPIGEFGFLTVFLSLFIGFPIDFRQN